MIKNILFSIIAVVAFVLPASSQKLSHSFGVTGMVLNGDIVATGKNYKYTPMLFGITYFPRVSFALTESASISAGLPLTIGPGFINNPAVGIKGTFISYDIPFAIDYNDAFKAADPGDERLGFYLGAGIGMTKFSPDSIPNSKHKASSTGIMVRGGVRIGSLDDENYRGISIGIFHRVGFEFARYKTTGVSVLYEF